TGEHVAGVRAVDRTESDPVQRQRRVAAQVGQQRLGALVPGAAGVRLGHLVRRDDIDPLDLDERVALAHAVAPAGAITPAGEDLRTLPAAEGDRDGAVGQPVAQPRLEQHAASVANQKFAAKEGAQFAARKAAGCPDTGLYPDTPATPRAANWAAELPRISGEGHPASHRPFRRLPARVACARANRSTRLARRRSSGCRTPSRAVRR